MKRPPSASLAKSDGLDWLKSPGVDCDRYVLTVLLGGFRLNVQVHPDYLPESGRLDLDLTPDAPNPPGQFDENGDRVK